MIKKYKLAMFDMDGTLYDTRMAHYLSYKKVLKNEGVELSFEYFRDKCFGGHYSSFLAPVTDNVERVHDEKLVCYDEFIGDITENTRLFELISKLKNDHYIALVTTASAESVYKVLRYFDREDCFDVIVTQEQVKKKKPDPEAYLYTMEHFGIGAENCIIFEDSETGLAAAHASGAKVIKVDDFN